MRCIQISSSSALRVNGFGSIHFSSTSQLRGSRRRFAHRCLAPCVSPPLRSGVARLFVSVHHNPWQNPFGPMGQGTVRHSQHSLVHCMRPASGHTAARNRITTGSGSLNDRGGRPGGISRQASFRPPHNRRNQNRRSSHAAKHQ